MDLFLLPGMDGTGALYSRLVRALPETWEATIVDYPADVVLGDAELLDRVRSRAPERHYVLVAESYSTPLAIRFAATRPEHLVGVVLCAGFASSPVRGWRRLAARVLSPVLFRLPLSDQALGWLLVGEGAEASLLDEVRAAIALVRPFVLAARLRGMLDCDVRDDLPKVDVPILYLLAEIDRLVGTECLAEIQRIRKDVVIEQIAGPHLVFQREPEFSAKAIELFALSVGIGSR